MAVKSKYSVRFYDATVLLAALEKGCREGMLEAKLKEINRYRLLIVDEIGYVPFSPGAAHIFFLTLCRGDMKRKAS